jgi:hypothetical protein
MNTTSERSLLLAEIARCDAQIAEYSEQSGCPAWLAALGVEDWRAERRLIQRELDAAACAAEPTTAP